MGDYLNNDVVWTDKYHDIFCRTVNFWFDNNNGLLKVFCDANPEQDNFNIRGGKIKVIHNTDAPGYILKPETLEFSSDISEIAKRNIRDSVYLYNEHMNFEYW